MGQANASLKNNRGLLKKRKRRTARDLLLGELENQNLSFKEVSPKELAKIKQKIRKRAREHRKNQVFLYTVSIVIALILLLLVFR